MKFFPRWAARVVVDEGDILSLLDYRLDRAADAEELSKICKVAYWCIQDDEFQRPSMGQVVQILEGVLDVNLPPIHALFKFTQTMRSTSFSSPSHPRARLAHKLRAKLQVQHLNLKA